MELQHLDDKVDWTSLYNELFPGAFKSAGVNKMITRCPFHKGGQEKHPSFWFNTKNGCYKCEACGATGNGVTLLSQLKGISQKEAYHELLKRAGLAEKPRMQAETGKYSLETYAVEKSLPLDFLKSMGLSDNGRGGVLIPYYNQDGQLYATRVRHHPNNDPRFTWRPGAKILPYGVWLERVQKAEKLILVEGESDAQALWLRNLPALGIPGASHFQAAWCNEYVKDRDVYLHIEPDQSGETFLKKTSEQLREGGYKGKAFMFSCTDIDPNCKDPSDLHICHAENFVSLISKQLEQAKSVELNPEETWLPLPEVNAPPVFPVDCLPDIAKKMVLAVAESLQVPLDMPCCFLLGIASIALLGRTFVQVKEDYLEPIQLYVAVSAQPSERKSAALFAILRPLSDWVLNINAQRQNDVDVSIQNMKSLEKQLDKATAKGDEQLIRELVAKKNEMEVLHPVELYLTDATTEAITRAMAWNDGRIAMVSGEAAIFSVLAGAYSEQVNLDVLLQGYSGEPISVARIGREPVRIKHASLAITLAVQPTALTGFLSNEMLLGRGLCARFLYAQPASMLGRREIRNVPSIPFSVKEAYANLMRELAACQEEKEPFFVRLSPEAREVYYQWAEEVERRLTGDLQGIAGGWEGKLCGNTVRIAGILKMLADPNRENTISALHMRWAVEIARYFIAHAKAVTGCDSGLSSEACEALEYIRKMNVASFSPATMRQKLRKRQAFKQGRSVDNALFELQEVGYLRLGDPPPSNGQGRPPEATWKIHPDLCKARVPTITQTEVVEL